MRSLRASKSIALIGLLALTATACGGAGFDPPEKIKSLRILAVQKSIPYPKPGEEVTLKLLYWDGKVKEGSPARPIDVEFSPPCINPLGDVYYNCYKDLLLGPLPGGDLPEGGVGADLGDGGLGSIADASLSFAPDAAAGDASALDASIDDGAAVDAATASSDASAASEGGVPPDESDHVRTFTFRVPAFDRNQKPIIHPGQQPGQKYGLVYILFAACAGQLEIAAPTVANGVPLVCKNGDVTLGPDDFVPGYTSLYVYDDQRNANPVLNDLLMDWPAHPEIQNGKRDGASVAIPPCLPGASCPTYDLKVDFPLPHVAEKDTGSGSDNLDEQMWVAYYATGGSFDHPLRLVNDAVQHWNEDNGAKFTAPAETGPVRIWAVVHDNRGGVAWIERKVFIGQEDAASP
jgi:hypothetical protein